MDQRTKVDLVVKGCVFFKHKICRKRIRRVKTELSEHVQLYMHVRCTYTRILGMLKKTTYSYA